MLATVLRPLAPSSPADEQRWMALGHVDVEGGVTPLYPQRMGQVKSIEAKENEAVAANAPLFHLDDSLETMQLQRAENALAVAKQELTLTEQKVQAYHKQIDAQKAAVEVARFDVKLGASSAIESRGTTKRAWRATTPIGKRPR